VVDNGIMPNRISLSDIPAVLDSVIFTKSGVRKVRDPKKLVFLGVFGLKKLSRPTVLIGLS